VATTDFKSVDEYLASLPPQAQTAVTQLRQLVKQVAPESAEAISYQIPAFLLDRNRVYVAGYKNHVSVYPTSTDMEEAFEGALTRYKSGKGTLRFDLDKPLPLDLIERVLRYRLEAPVKTKAKK
jgi:uncharacterized protein YdhG (YjbR/CyaY superfamily)